MKAQTMLNKIMTLLSMKEEVELAYGQLKDGTILESNTFDVGETIDVVSEDGSKSPAPTGEHEIALKDSDGNEVIIRVLVADGKITERSNVEEAAPEAPEESQVEIEKEMEMEVEIVPVENIPVLDDKDARIMALENKIMQMEAMINEFKSQKMAAVDPDEEEVDVPELDGAPIDENQVNLSSFKFKGKSQTTMDRVLQNISK
jgi:hypothetical protein